MATVLANIQLRLASESKNFAIYAPIEGAPATGKFYLAKSLFSGKPPAIVHFPVTVPE
jgi:hypothetical protein